MMDNMSAMMGGMGILWILLFILLVLGIAALDSGEPLKKRTRR